MSEGFVAAGAGRFRVAGDLDFETVPAAWESSRRALDGAGDVLIDLAGVGRVDSAGLALVVEWVRWASAAGAALRFANVPDKLRSLARISELESLFDGASRAG